MFLYAIGYARYTSVRVDQEICNTFKMFCFKRILFQTDIDKLNLPIMRNGPLDNMPPTTYFKSIGIAKPL